MSTLQDRAASAAPGHCFGSCATVQVIMFALSLAVVALSSLPVSAPPTQPQTILGGDVVGACGWPNVVSMGGSCSGTLIHPEVVLYAAHCGDEVPWIRFGDTIEGPSREVVPEHCAVHPIGSFGFGTDYAYCLLAEPITDVPITPPLMGCDAEERLVVGEPATIVGFGQSDDPDEPYGIKREVTTEIKDFSWGEVFVGDEKKGACYGDSGGPVLVQLGDGTWRTFGITSWGKGGCGAGNYFSLVHFGMEWVETETGIDVTPCHDTSGNWDPSPACGGFATGLPGVAEGSWDTCTWGEISGLSSTCGSAFDDSPDRDAPVVTIVDPGDGARFNSLGGGVELEISVGVEDVGWGADSVTMRVVEDGDVLFEAEDHSAPFLFPPLNFADGVWTVEAEAVDRAGNIGVSEPITFGVNADPPTPAATTSSSGGDTGDTAGETGTTEPEGTGSSGGDDTSATGDPGDPSVDGESGCGCRSGGPGAQGLFGLALLGLVRRRRRALSGIASVLAVGALTLVGCGDDGVALSGTTSESGVSSDGSTTSDMTSAGATGPETSTSGSTDSDGTTSTGEALPICGNGQVDGADELCDDGNNVDGDGCNADCTPSGSELDRHTLADRGRFTRLRIDAAGDLLASGQSGAGEEFQGWLAKFDVEGTLLWEYTHPDKDVESGLSDFALDGEQLVAVGWVRGDAYDSWLAVINSADGSVASSDLVNLDEDDTFSEVVVADEQRIILARVSADATPVVYSFDANLKPKWTYEPNIADAKAGPLTRTPDGHTIVVFGDKSGSSQGLFMVKLADDGTEVWTRTHSDPLTRYFPTDLVVDADGRVVLCGEIARTEASDTLFFGFDADGDERWRARYPIAGPGYDWCAGAALTDDGAVGFAGVAFTQSKGWEGRAGKVDVETGLLRWSRTIGGPGSHNDSAGAVAALPGGELIIGATITDGTTHPTLVRLSP